VGRRRIYVFPSVMNYVTIMFNFLLSTVFFSSLLL
jgi:hypothetical protein